MNGYATHADFKALFKGQLITYLRHLRHNPPEMPKPTSTKPKIDVPYRGLRALREEDVPIFFGRTAEASDVLTRIEKRRFVPVLGASGSGKSSLIMAGVLPQLTKQGWRVIQCMPSSQPFDQLALAIVSQIPEMRVAPMDYLNESAKLAITLRQNPQNVVTQLRAVLPNQRIVIYIDQFEELFTVSEKSAIAPFIQAIRHEAHDITTIITMRADFYETALTHLDELKDATYGLKKPSIFALYEMITRPAIEAEYLLEDGLAGRIIDDISEDSGALALVAYVMETMYLRAKARGDSHITHVDYEALGGVQGAINTLADKAYGELPFADKETVLRDVFFHLIALTADENGQLVPTRHRYPLGNFPKNSPERDLIDRFADARLLVKDSTTVEVAHEAILRHWEQLKAWIDANKVSMAVYRQFERDAIAWERNPNQFPLPTHEQLTPFYNALNTLGETWDALKEPLKTYTIPEAMRLLRELADNNTPPARRLQIGHKLNDIGDPRIGVGTMTINGFRLPQLLWCLVPAGEFAMGSDNNGDDEAPEHTLHLPDFYMSRYLITYAQYETFNTAHDFDADTWWLGFPDQYKRQKLAQRFQYANHPRENVTWYMAMAFCRWVTYHSELHQVPMLVWDNKAQIIIEAPYQRIKMTLPSEAEYEKMARGGDKRMYPYGDMFDYTKVNTSEAGIGMTSAVGAFPSGKSAYGILDASGNVWKWTRSIFSKYKYNSNDGRESGVVDVDNRCSIRGGSWGSSQDFARASYRGGSGPIYGFNIIGFFVVCHPY